MQRLGLIAGASLLALVGVSPADDHLSQAQQHGFSSNTRSHAFTTNKAGHSGDLAPGQGSAFAGADTKTPATDTAAADAHANTKSRTPK